MNVLDLVFSNLTIGNTAWLTTDISIEDVYTSSKIKEAFDKHDKNFNLKEYKFTKNIKIINEEGTDTKIQHEIRMVNEKGIHLDEIISQISKFVSKTETKLYRFDVNETQRNITIKIHIS